MAKKQLGRGTLPNQLRHLSIVLAMSGAASAAGLAGCSSDGSGGTTEDPAVVSARTNAGNDLQQSLNDVSNEYETCVNQLVATGTCVLPAGPATQGVRVIITDTKILGLPGAAAIQYAQQKIAQIKQIFAQIGNNICDVIGPFASLNHPYFYYGGSVQGGPGVQGQAGVDVVFDMTNLQAATFGYKGVGAAASISVGASAYAGYGFGDKKGVIDAWSGRFCSAGASINLPAKFLSAGASAFMSPDGSVYGAAVSVGAGVGLPAAQLGDISAFASDWTAWNGGTEAISQNGFLINQKIVKDADGHEYIQYASPKDMALALLFDAPMPLGATAAAQVIALDLQKKSGLTIEQMCPAQAAAAGPPPVVKAVGNACDAIPSVDKLVQGAKNIITPPSPPTNIVNGDAGPPIKDTCVGKADGIYCSELAAFSAIQCCNHSICGGQQCAGGTSAKCVGPNGPGTMIVCQ